jgi:hypothetical protein
MQPSRLPVGRGFNLVEKPVPKGRLPFKSRVNGPHQAKNDAQNSDMP